MATKQGKVFLVGAGPGDPDLMTIKGRECIRRADVIIYDHLADPVLLTSASKNTEIIYAGKKGGHHTLSQTEINALIISKAKKGGIVTRLKGGDPFVFGRGGEEAQTLVEAGVSFEVVPGVTSAIAAPAYAGIPLTHRNFTSAFTVVTGHEDPLKSESRINWSALAKIGGTIVFLMGVKNLPHIVQQLIRNGMDADTPVALVRWGTTPRQKAVTGTLANIVAKTEAAGIKAPAIIVIGDVVRLRKDLNWFEKRPLMGKCIVVTRARKQASHLVKRLSELGAECLEYPTIEIIPPDDWEPLDQALAELSFYDWVIYTSVNGVDHFFQRLFAIGKDARALHHLNIATIGPETARRLFDFGIKSDIIPESYRAESVIDALAQTAIKGTRILLPRAEKARPLLPRELTRMGALVNEITAYRTRSVVEDKDRLTKQLEAGTVDLITFTSSSTVENFKSLLPPHRFDQLVAGMTVACIGPITADTAKSLGFDVHIIAESFTIPGLCAAITQYYQTQK